MKLFDAYGREVDTGLLKDEQALPTLALLNGWAARLVILWAQVDGSRPRPTW